MIVEGCSAAIETYKACLCALEAIEADEQLDAALGGLSIREHQLGVAAGLRRIADRIEDNLDAEEASNDADAD